MNAPIKVLVASPDTKLRNWVRDALRASGCELLLASETSLALFLVYKNLPSLIVCDIALAGDPAGDLIAHLRHDPHTASTPLVLIAGAAGNAEFSSEQYKNIPTVTATDNPENFRNQLKSLLPK